MMRTLLLAAAMAAAFAGMTPAQAADRAVAVYQGNVHVRVLPFPRSERAEAVWASGGCWTACSAETTWTLAACLSFDSQGRCLTRADAGDRGCQRTCRLRGGPYLPLD